MAKIAATPPLPMLSLRKKPAKTTPAVRRLHVLIADDVEEISKLVGLWLEEAGHAVTYATDGRAVLRLVREKPYDLLVTDILMPNGDGWDAILACNRLRPAMRILAISGGGKHMGAEACLRVAKGVGADHILRKPFNRAQFLAAVGQVMGR